MSKKLFVFGNGLGRAIDNDFYSLERVLKLSWKNPDVVTDEQKRLICNCLDRGLIQSDDLDAPTGERELSGLQRVLDACDTIIEFEPAEANHKISWLTPTGREFPQSIRRYLHYAASLFHNNEMRLPDAFSEALKKYVRQERPSIATLNYDDLLYECFTGTDIFGGLGQLPMLRDGFFKGPFAMELQEEWWNPECEGWFLHLHGSPLFITNKENLPMKITRAKLSGYQGHSSVHLVLTDIESKPAVIQGSEILSAYWKKFEKLVKSSSEITLFGYGGGDKHLNSLIAVTNEKQRVRVICHQGSDNVDKWYECLYPKDRELIDIIQLDNVLEFADW